MRNLPVLAGRAKSTSAAGLSSPKNSTNYDVVPLQPMVARLPFEPAKADGSAEIAIMSDGFFAVGYVLRAPKTVLGGAIIRS